MNCFVDKKKCKKANTEWCNMDCKAFIMMEAIYSQSQIPKLYQMDKALEVSQDDLKSYQELHSYKNAVVKNVEEGKNLFIYSGKCGNGKTTWATKIAHEYIKKKVFGRNIENLVYYMNVPEFLEELRLGYEDGTYAILINKIKKFDLVIFDDIGAEKSTEWARERLYTLINYRTVNCKCSIYTSNNSTSELENVLGSRICSRLNNSTKIKLVGVDRRSN